MKIESALIIVVPEAEPLVQELRQRFDWSAAQGVPAHITILYPFIPPDKITPEVTAELRELFAQYAAFEFSLPETRRFPTVLYLAPSPAEPFKALTQAVSDRYPEYPPYGGEFPISDLTPHLTVADKLTAEQIDDLERKFMNHHSAQLPVNSKAQAVTLIENSAGRWETRDIFKLTAR